MRDGKIAIEINLKKLAVIAGMVLSVWLSSVCGEGEVLMLIIPAGISYLVSKEARNGISGMRRI